MGVVEQGSLLAGLAKELVWTHQAESDRNGRLVCRSHRSSWPCRAWRAARDVCREAGMPVATMMPSSSTVEASASPPVALGAGVYARSDRAPALASDGRLMSASTAQAGSATRPQPSGSGSLLSDRGIGAASWN
jgi:hypothetical protein